MGNVCNSKRIPRVQALRQGCPITSTGFLAGTQGHFKHNSATEHVSVSFQLTFPETSWFPSAAPTYPAAQYTAADRASQSIPSEALAAKPKHLTSGQFPSRQKFTISKESIPFCLDSAPGHEVWMQLYSLL